MNEIQKFIEWQAQGDRKVEITVDTDGLTFFAYDRKITTAQIVKSFAELDLEKKRKEELERRIAELQGINKEVPF